VKTATQGVVTARGIRDGDPSALRALCERRGAAVLAYCEELLSGPAVGVAAADAFARFRREVIAADRLASVNPEALLLRSTRRAALERAPRGDGGRSLRDVVRGRRATCDGVPELLAAHAEELLSEADEERLARHLSACSACHELAERFMRAEHAYRDPPDRPVPAQLVNTIVAALSAAASHDADEIRAARPINRNGDVSRAASGSALAVNGARSERPQAPPPPARRFDPRDDDAPTVVVPALESRRERDDRVSALLTRLLSGDFAVRVGIPAAVVAVGVIVTLAIAGVFSSSDQRGSPPAQAPSTLPARLAPATLVAASHAPASSVPEELARAAQLAQDKRRQEAAAARAQKQSTAPTTGSTTTPTAETTPPAQSVQKVTPTKTQYNAEKGKRTTKRPPSSPSGQSPSSSSPSSGTPTTSGGTEPPSG
jgi:hypothetical protein